MFKNYLKIAFRNISRYKGYSFINIFGLAIAVICCIFIFLYVDHEMSYDRYHADHDRVFRVAEDIQTKTANRIFAPVSPPLAPALKENFPQVEYAGRLMDLRPRLVKYKDKLFYENNGFAADQEVLHIFNIPFLKGSSSEALVRPHTLVVTEEMAAKYFGNGDPLGKTLKLNSQEYEITGVAANPPGNTHWKYNYIISLKTYEKWQEMNNWHATMAYTYIKLAPGVNANDFEKQIGHIADKYVGNRLKGWGEVYRYFLQPISDIHLYSHIRYEIEPPGDPKMIIIFSTVGLLVLLIACINFINLTTARSANRAKEVGLRKVVGGQRKQLIFQFVGESFILALAALIAAMSFTGLIMPLFNKLLGTQFTPSSLYQLPVLLVMLALVLFIGLAAGLYPAFILSGFKPASVLKAAIGTGSTRSLLRKILVVMQFSISIILIIITIGVHQQLQFMKHQYLGFDKEQKLVIPFGGGISIEKNYNMVKNQYLQHSGVLNAAVSSNVPGRGVNNFAVKLVGEDDDKNQSMFHLYFDPDFIPNYNIKMVAGRGFNKEMATDEKKTCVINRAALKAFGWRSPQQALGKVLNTGYGVRDLRIIGITEDFHYRGLQYKVEPLVMEWNPERFRSMTLTINTENLGETLAFIGKTWKSLFPGYPFEYYFLDDDFNQQYLAEERTGALFGVFTILGQFIACLGLLGLAAFTTQRRTREIGVRKVLGASIPGITFLVSREFLKWVVLANIIAWPAAYIAMDQWLSSFAYRAPIDIWSFIVSALLALLVAIVTVSYQSLRAAATNPMEALRYE
ncbi:MAG: ABC transporter permease [Candidatus Aminicenantes bacterium]|jgi:putative ABC transport system permease protein